MRILESRRRAAGKSVESHGALALPQRVDSQNEAEQEETANLHLRDLNRRIDFPVE
jgi:hypothetical protein